MGVGYTVSALHQLVYIEPDPDGTERIDPPPFLLYLPPGVHWDGRPMRWRSPEKTAIVAWRQRLSEKYHSQLGEDLLWDEDDEFHQGEDIRSSTDVSLHYVAAVLDERGEESAARALKGTTKPRYEQMHVVFEAAEQRGLMGKFPHLLAGSAYWLPFERNIIIEEPDWRGTVRRFASAKRLSVEIDVLRAFIAAADPSATAWSNQSNDEPPDVLASAWQASDTVFRLCTIALDCHLPLWWAG